MKPLILIFFTFTFTFIFTSTQSSSHELINKNPPIYINNQNYQQKQLDFLHNWTINPSIGGHDLNIIISIKSFQQHQRKYHHHINDHKGGHNINEGDGQKRYLTKGVVIGMNIYNLEKIDIDINEKWKLYTNEPMDVNFFENNSIIVIACGRTVLVIDFETFRIKEIENIWFGHLHSIEFSSNGKNLLITSTGYEKIIEIDWKTEKVIWEWSPWEYGSGYNKEQIRDMYFVRTKEERKKLKEEGKRIVRLVDDPEKWEDGIGIPTRYRPCHINIASYGRNGDIITSFAKKGLLLTIDKKTSKPKEVFSNLKMPHGFAKIGKEEYIVTDTKVGNVLFLDKDFKIDYILSLKDLPGVKEGRKNVGEWTQNCNHLKDDLYSIIDIHRGNIYIIDKKKREYRIISFPDNWSVHSVKLIPNNIMKLLKTEFAQKLSKISETEKRLTVIHDLVNKELDGDEKYTKLRDAQTLPRIYLTKREIIDFEMIANGAFTPLTGFMNEKDFNSVVEHMKLINGETWTIPIIKSINVEEKKNLLIGEKYSLVDEFDAILGIIEIDDIYYHDKQKHSLKVYGTSNLDHPGVDNVYKMGDFLVGGEIFLLNHVNHTTLNKYRLSPNEILQKIRDKRWNHVVCFQTRNPIHRSHEFMLEDSLKYHNGLLIHPIIGERKKDDIPSSIVIASYDIVQQNFFPKNRVILAGFPAWMRYAGPREGILHGIVRRNFGCTHFVVGRDHAGVGNYYDPFEAQNLFTRLQYKIGIRMISFEEIYYCEKCGKTTNRCEHDKRYRLSISGSEVRKMINNGIIPPEESIRVEISKLLISFSRFKKLINTTEINKISSMLDELLKDQSWKELSWDMDYFLIYNLCVKGELLGKFIINDKTDDIYFLRYGNILSLDLYINKTRRIFALELIKNSSSDIVSSITDEKKVKNAFVLWFTGIPCTGKTTLANGIVKELKKKKILHDHLDGDYVRKIMNRDLGFSKEDREINLKRVTNVCKELIKNDFIAISSFVSPFNKTRLEIRSNFENFIEIYVNTTFEECERRDVKGLYKLARKGVIKEFTGVSSPYEESISPEIVVETTKKTVEESIEYIINILEEKEYFEVMKE